MDELYEKRKLKDAEVENSDEITKKISNSDKQYGKKSSLKYQKRKSEQEVEPEFDVVKEPDQSTIDEVSMPPKKAKIHEVKPNNILLVRNIPFQSNVKEIKSLFKPIAGFVNARLPNKVTGGHRGFGFIEFDSTESAKIALDSLGKVTHFLGRRLLLEFAKNTTV